MRGILGLFLLNVHWNACDNDNETIDNDSETILLPWSYIISTQYTKQHTRNQYNIFTCSGSKYSVHRFEKNW